ncbi:RCC1/BLIP-II [Epithele typhae]|uniref:RCC1/BLIP-II n=1 Tax=Epithele typhae TaxID=378194 RepID=UPI0020088507|nr:RCC1/BLIP-II [Epithele typhae]KAH9910489.1 RCC1/BLIP-II [Epithele typhae]
MPSLFLYSAGSNARGQLATGDQEDAHHFTPSRFSNVTTPGRLPDGAVGLRQVACGANHTLALLEMQDGVLELWGCGDGRRGQLGPSYDSNLANTTFRPLDLLLGGDTEGYAVRIIAAGWETSYVVLSRAEADDVVLSMGADDRGALGVGGTDATSSTPSAPRTHTVPLRPLLSDLGHEDATLQVLALSAGPHHVIAHVRALRPDGSAFAFLAGWGAARHGQLGPLDAPAPFLARPTLVSMPTTHALAALALGQAHSAFLREDGTLGAMGATRKNQYAGLAGREHVAAVACTWHGTYALFRSGVVVAAGSGAHGQLGRGREGVERSAGPAPVQFPFAMEPGRAARIACGSEHALCLVDQGERGGMEVWGWGWNEHGNLGLGSTEDVHEPTRVWPPAEEGARRRGEAINIWAGCGTSWVLVLR